MNPKELSLVVDQVLTDVRAAVGPSVDAARLEQATRTAVQDLWLSRPKVTIYLAELALRRVRDAFAGFPTGGPPSAPAVA